MLRKIAVLLVAVDRVRTEMTDPEDILQAEKEIRREGVKAAFLHAAVEGTVFFIAVFFALTSVEPGWIPESVGTETTTVPGVVAASVALGVVFMVADAAFVYRSRTLEYFEEANPQIKEALRTARDAAKRDEENLMAHALYDDVLEELRTTSSEGFVDVRRMVGSVVVVVAIGLLLLGVSFSGGGVGDGLFGESPFGGSGGSDEQSEGEGGGTGGERQYDELQDPSEVLGESGEVTRGTDDEEIELRRSGTGGDGGGDTGQVGDGRDYTGGVEVESRRAEYSPEEDIEDAELVKEYNLRIRGEE